MVAWRAWRNSRALTRLSHSEIARPPSGGPIHWRMFDAASMGTVLTALAFSAVTSTTTAVSAMTSATRCHLNSAATAIARMLAVRATGIHGQPGPTAVARGALRTIVV